MRTVFAFVAAAILLAGVAVSSPAEAQEPACTAERPCATVTLEPTPAPNAPDAGTGLDAHLVSTGEALFIVAMATLALGGLVLAIVPGRSRR